MTEPQEPVEPEDPEAPPTVERPETPPARSDTDDRADRFERKIDSARPSDLAVRPTTSSAPQQVVDAWCFVGPYRSRERGTPYELEHLLEEHARFGIESRLCLHAESRDGVPDEGNHAMSRMAPVAPGTGVMWTVLPPRRFVGTKAEQLIGDAESAGIGMFALFPKTHAHHSAPWANRELYAAMQEARLPLALDLEQTSYDEVHAIAAAYPKLPILLWGAWYVDERLVVPLLDVCPNVLVGLAGNRRAFIPTFGIEQFSARYGLGRLVFGSGWPAQSPGPYLSYVRYASVRDHVKDAILGDTVRALLAAVRWRVRAFEATP